MPLHGEYAPSTTDWAREQAELFERSGGTEGNILDGVVVVVMTSVGVKSGKLRKNGLVRVEHNGEYAAIASRGGKPQNPGWYHNLLANPHVELQDGPVKRDYHAREVTGAEREEWWARAVEVYPTYGEYQKRTDRLIPVFVLTAFEDES